MRKLCVLFLLLSLRVGAQPFPFLNGETVSIPVALATNVINGIYVAVPQLFPMLVTNTAYFYSVSNYVSPNGAWTTASGIAVSAGNDGTALVGDPTHPWKSLDAAGATVGAGNQPGNFTNVCFMVGPGNCTNKQQFDAPGCAIIGAGTNQTFFFGNPNGGQSYAVNEGLFAMDTSNYYSGFSACVTTNLTNSSILNWVFGADNETGSDVLITNVMGIGASDIFYFLNVSKVNVYNSAFCTYWDSAFNSAGLGVGMDFVNCSFFGSPQPFWGYSGTQNRITAMTLNMAANLYNCNINIVSTNAAVSVEAVMFGSSAYPALIGCNIQLFGQTIVDPVSVPVSGAWLENVNQTNTLTGIPLWRFETTHIAPNYFGGSFNGNGGGLTNVVGVQGITYTNLAACITGTNAIHYTVPAGMTNGYTITGFLTVTALSLDVIQPKIIWTDEKGTVQTISLGSSISTTGWNNLPYTFIRAKGGTVIDVTNTLTTGTGSVTYDVSSHLIPMDSNQ